MVLSVSVSPAHVSRMLYREVFLQKCLFSLQVSALQQLGLQRRVGAQGDFTGSTSALCEKAVCLPKILSFCHTLLLLHAFLLDSFKHMFI